MVETGSEIVNAIINNPMEAVILSLGIYVFYKLFVSRHKYLTRRTWSRNIGDFFGWIDSGVSKLIWNTDTYCGLQTDKLDQTEELIRKLPTISYHGLYNFIEAKLEVGSIERYKIIKALENQNRIKRNIGEHTDHWVLVD